MGQTSEFLVDERYYSIERGLITLAPIDKQAGDFLWWNLAILLGDVGQISACAAQIIAPRLLHSSVRKPQGKKNSFTG